MQSELEIKNLEIKAKVHGWSTEQLEQEKQKLIELNLKFNVSEEELNEKAREAGFKSYEDQKAQGLVKKLDKDVYDIENVIVPPPMVKKIQALEFTEPEVPGEIKIDTSGKLLKTFFEYEGQIGSIIDQYNNFITNSLAEQVYSKSLTIQKGEITFENIILNRPLKKDITGEMKPLYPHEARTSGYSYTADIYVDFVLNKGTLGEERLDKTFLGKVPVMLGSELDWLSNKSPEERGKLGEGLNDPFGYFVIKGTEKIVLIQEKLRANRFFVFNSNNRGDVVCKITNNTLAGSSQITMVKGKKSGAIKVHLGFLGRLNTPASNKLGKTISVFQIYRMLGITNTKDILNYIFLFTKPENIKKMYVALQPNLVKLSKIGDDIEYISKKKGLGDLDYNIRKTDIMTDLLNQLFPQIPPENIQGKIYMLSIMIVRLLEYLIGVRKLDDRDNWGNKQLVTAGKSLELLFASIWREAIAFVQNEIDEKRLNGLNAVKAAFKPSFVTDNFIESFTANNWGVQSANSYMKKENITDILKRDSVLSVYSHLTKINTPGSTKVKSSKIRMVQMSQLGYVDAGETPEGQLCIKVGTPVLMGDFTWKKIEDIIEGDEVITVNPLTLEKSPSRIEKPFRFHTKDSYKQMYSLTTVNGKEIQATGDHPFLTEYGWIPLDKLNPKLDSVCIMDKNSCFSFEDILKIVEVEDSEVADFTTVSDNHSFIANYFVTHNCGLAKNAAMTAYMSLDRPEEIIVEMVGKNVSGLPTESQKNPFMLNGVFMGWVNGEEMEKFTRSMKTGLKLPKDTCIVLEDDGFFNIYTDAARPTRPLLIVDSDGRLVIEKKNLWKADFDTLLREGCVEYVDAWEQENIMLAQTLDDISYRNRDIEMALRYVKEAQEKILGPHFDEEDLKNDQIMLSQAEAALKELSDLQRYTHSEIDPVAIMSIAIGIIPLAETNPGPRLTYQAGMGKQSLGIYHSNHAIRFDTTSKILAYPSRPMFETQFNEIIGLNELPAGETVILAITTYSGFSQEDAIIMAQGAIDRGLFRSIVYKTYKSVLKPNEKFARPEIRKGLEDKYAAIDENGLPRLGAFVKEGDALIGKIRVSSSTGKIEDVSSYVEVKQEGVIDRVLVSTNAENNRVVKVKIRQVRKPVMGDKFACYTPDHEVMTLSRGWVKIDELTLKDKVLTLKGWENPTNIQTYDYDGEMYSVQSENVDLCVTPNHRMYVKINEEYEILTAENIFGKSVTYKKLDSEVFESGNDKWIQYKGKVHCCTVPSGIIYVRRNGKPVWCGNSRYAQKGTVGLILPDEDMPFTDQGVRPDIIINPHCFTKDTPISLSDGTFKMNADFSKDGGEKVWSWDIKNKKFVEAISAGLESKGVKKIVKVILENGETLRCTPDHMFFTTVYEWVEAEKLLNKYVLSNFENNKVIGIFEAGEEEVFDIGVHEHHNFLANGCVVHNCMPSRMTIGKMIEIVTSKVAAFTGERVNATAFRRFDVKEFMRNLIEYGYSSSGKERMYSGFTGQPLEAMIFTGPCYYQALRHQVPDKIQMRARGQLSQLTHQPVEGRKRGGGLRIGEMERDALISHGASAFLRERLCLVSDAYETVFCSTCGTMAISNVIEEKYICRNCDERAVFGTCVIPYGFKLLTQLLAGANFQTRFKMREVPK